jgi:hypothetical protein
VIDQKRPAIVHSPVFSVKGDKMDTIKNIAYSAENSYNKVQAGLQPLKEGKGTLKGTMVTYAAMPLFAISLPLYATGCIEKTAPLLSAGALLGSWSIYGNKMFTRYLPRMNEMVVASCLLGEPGVEPETGAWKTNDGRVSRLSEKVLGKGTAAYWQFFNRGLCNEGLIPWCSEMGAKTVLDVCCGEEAPYVKAMNKMGIDARGIDLNLQQSLIDHGSVVVGNVLKTFPEAVNKKFDLVMSIESGAKLLKGSEKTYIQNLTDHAEKAVFCSWPIPGQQGPHQNNPLSNEQVTAIFNEYGWIRDKEREDLLKASVDKIDFWFSDTLMVFVPKKN